MKRGHASASQFRPPWQTSGPNVAATKRTYFVPTKANKIVANKVAAKGKKKVN